MRINKIYIIICLVGLVGSAAHAVDDEILKQLPKFVICKNSKIVRTVRVTKNDKKECITTYTKLGVDRVVGTAIVNSSCFTVYENIQKNLGIAGWTCKDISSAKISDPE